MSISQPEVIYHVRLAKILIMYTKQGKLKIFILREVGEQQNMGMFTAQNVQKRNSKNNNKTMDAYKFEYDKLLSGWFCWKVRWQYLELIEWIEEQYPFVQLKY